MILEFDIAEIFRFCKGCIMMVMDNELKSFTDKIGEKQSKTIF